MTRLTVSVPTRRRISSRWQPRDSRILNVVIDRERAWREQNRAHGIDTFGKPHARERLAHQHAGLQIRHADKPGRRQKVEPDVVERVFHDLLLIRSIQSVTSDTLFIRRCTSSPYASPFDVRPVA